MYLARAKLTGRLGVSLLHQDGSHVAQSTRNSHMTQTLSMQVMTGSLVQASQVTVEVEDAGFADRALRQTQPSAPTNNVACSAGLSAVKFGADVICVQSADGKPFYKLVQLVMTQPQFNEVFNEGAIDCSQQAATCRLYLYWIC